MVARMLCAALLGAVIGGAELAGRYQERPMTALFSPSGLLYVVVNAAASMLALIGVQALGWTFVPPAGTPDVSAAVAQVTVATAGAAAILRSSIMITQDKGVSIGPVLLLSALLRIADVAMERRRALGRLSGNDLHGLSFARDHAALAELCSHALRRYDLAEAQRLGELAADLRSRGDLSDADKLDCFGLELSRMVGDRALGKAADRLRDRPVLEEVQSPPAAATEEGDLASRLGSRLARGAERAEWASAARPRSE